jgi:hypothetical protein
VQQAIDAAEVDERTVVGDVLDDALDDGAFLQVFQQLLALFTHAGFEHGTARNHHVVALAVELDDLEFVFLAFEGRGVLDRTRIDQRTGEEGADAIDHDGQAALDLAGDQTLDQGAVGQGLVEIVPGGDALGLFAREARCAVAVFEHLDRDQDEIARLGFEFAAFIVEFLDGNHAFGLESGVDDHEVLVDANDFGRDDFTGTHFLALEAFLEQGGKALHG